MLSCPQQPAAPTAADHYRSVSMDDLALHMANPQQPAAPAASDHDHYYSSVDDLAMDMADQQLGPEGVAPVEVGGLSGQMPVCLSVCLQGECPSCMMVYLPVCICACVLRPVVSGLVSVCLQGKYPDCMTVSLFLCLCLCYNRWSLWTCVCLSA